MQPRHRLRLARWLLAWFMLSLAVAMASPALQARNAHQHCPELADEAVAQQHHADEATAAQAQGHLHHCVLCGLLGGPPLVFALAAQSPPAAVPQPSCEAPVAAPCAPPLSARGPPLS